MATVTATAPASIGNFSVGFDMLGVAVETQDGTPLGDKVVVSPGTTDGHTLQLTGPFANWLPDRPEDNLVWHCLQRFEDDLPGALDIRLEKNLPVASGLGSSASSIVAAASAFNTISQKQLDQSALLRLCAELEGHISGDIHLDNIAPSLFGGTVLCNEGNADNFTHLELPAHWRLVLAYSGQAVTTQAMRKILPRRFPPEKLSLQMMELARFTHALGSGDHETAAACIVDHLAEPFRAPLLKGYAQARQYCLDGGALAVGISGSGPTLFAVCGDDQTAASLRTWLDRNYRVAEHAFARICKVQTAGAQVSSEA